MIFIDKETTTLSMVRKFMGLNLVGEAISHKDFFVKHSLRHRAVSGIT